MRKTLALTALVSGLALNSACGDTNNYYVSGSDDGKYTCKDACEYQIDCGENWRMDSCLADCTNEPWDQMFVDCLSRSCHGHWGEDCPEVYPNAPGNK